MVTQCTGDDYEYGSSGMWVNQVIPNTDPNLPNPYSFRATRIVYYEEPNQPVARAEELVEQASVPVGLYLPTPVVGTTPPIAPVLLQNFPNPFSDRTSIRFQVPAGSDAVLRIYDVAGRLIKDLGLEPGPYGEAVWDGTDLTGNRVPSGIYFYRLQTDRGIRTRKMLFIK